MFELTPMFELSKESFEAVILACGGNPMAQPNEYAHLIRAYTQPHRVYHTTQHLAECLMHLSVAYAEMPVSRSLARENAEIALALWYHDAVYRPQRDDNEVRSARWCGYRALQFGLSTPCKDRLVAMILATRHGIVSVSDDAQTQRMLDIDLAILAAKPARFRQYCAQIRLEYAGVPSALFARKRAEVLQGFLDLKNIYHSPFAAPLEAAARLNLSNEVALLAALAARIAERD